MYINKDGLKAYKEEIKLIFGLWGISGFILSIFACDYIVAYDNESVLYSGIILPKKSSYKGYAFVEYFQNNKSKISQIFKAGQTGSYVLFAKSMSNYDVVIEQNVGDAVYYYCKGGVHMNKRGKVEFLLTLNEQHISSGTFFLDNDISIISAVVMKKSDRIYYDAFLDNELIWYNEIDKMSNDGDSVLIMYEKKERFKYNVYKRNPSKEDFEKFKYGIDFCNPSIKDK